MKNLKLNLPDRLLRVRPAPDHPDRSSSPNEEAVPVSALVQSLGLFSQVPMVGVKLPKCTRTGCAAEGTRDQSIDCLPDHLLQGARAQDFSEKGQQGGIPEGSSTGPKDRTGVSFGVISPLERDRVDAAEKCGQEAHRTSGRVACPGLSRE